MVAAARAVATKAADPLINDPYAEPLVRAVGIDAFTRLISGEVDKADADDPVLNRRQMAEQPDSSTNSSTTRARQGSARR
jgi:O-methyltransferase involved in polyketide biosynthesis